VDSGAFLNPADPWAGQAFRLYLDRWHAHIEWETAVARSEGHACGYATANAETVSALKFALGGPDAKTWRQAVDHHHRVQDWQRRRAEADTTGSRPGDYPGGPVDWETGRPLSIPDDRR
jgi:hypothetical protein